MPPQEMHPSREANPRLIALIVACALFMGQLDTSVVLVAIPDMAHAFAVRPVDLSIGVTIYILAQAVMLPSSGWIADRFGARRIFTLALGGFTLASVLCGTCHTLPQFIAARIFQGVTAALMIPVARMVLLHSTRKEDLIGVTTISTVPMLVAPTVGPPIGGFITTYLSWPWIFLLNVPVGIAGVMLVLRYIPLIARPERRPFDWVGFVLLAGAAVGVLSGLEHLSVSGASWLPGMSLIAAGAVGGLIAVRHLARQAHPVLSLACARIATFRASTMSGGLFVRLPVRALPFILPLLFQEVLGYSAVYSGFALLAMNGGDLVLKSMTTLTLRRYGFRDVLIGSTVAMSAMIVLCALMVGQASYVLILIVLAACGMARSLLFTGMSTLAFADIPRPELGSATVMWNLVLQLTGAFGISLAAILLNLTSLARGEPAGHVSLRNCQVALLAMALLGALSLISFRRLPRDAGAHVSGHSPI
ncbi:MAG TPA: MFS transporter [Steroidobacteraceae bacterium]|nr:MFS transporter [Steroidobacteraceae bacterium]